MKESHSRTVSLTQQLGDFVSSTLNMPPGKIEFSPLSGVNLDDGDDNYLQLPQVPRNIVRQSHKYDGLESAAVITIDSDKNMVKPVYTVLSEDDDEENQYDVGILRKADGVIFATTGTVTDSEIASSTDEHDVNVDENSSTRERLVILLTQAGPVTVSFFLGFAGTFTNLIFASHFIGDDGAKSTVFAGISLANMFANVSCMSLLIGTE